MLLGVISAKIKTTKVNIPTATPGPTEPRCRVAKTVARADAAILATLLPINIAINMRWGSLFSLNNAALPRRPSLISDSERARDRETMAVSDAEKSAERHSKINKANISLIIVLGPKSHCLRQPHSF